MRRIVVIAAGMAGITCATRIKRRLPDSEVNVIIPAALKKLQAALRKDGNTGAVARRLAAGLPDLALLSTRETGVVEAQDIMTDTAGREVIISSEKGAIAIRYSELVLDVTGTVRLPRTLQNARNVFGWPVPVFAAEPEECDRALARAAAEGTPVVIVGNGVHALDAVFLAREAGAKAHWVHTGEKGVPTLDPLLLRHSLKALGPDVTYTALPDITPDRLACKPDDDKTLLRELLLPNGNTLRSPCFLWTSPLMARHPVLREPGVTLDSHGRIQAEAQDGPADLYFIGSAAAVPPAPLAEGLHAPVYAGEEENAELSALLCARAITGDSSLVGEPAGTLGAAGARTSGICLCRVGYSMAEATEQNLDAEYAVASLKTPEAGPESCLILSLVCDKRNRNLLGAQALGLGIPDAAVHGLFGMALAALAEGTTLARLASRPRMGLPGQLLARGAGILLNKLDTAVNGITPDELLASHAAGAEFFSLDLRPVQSWEQGHVLQAHNIPLPQLAKRLQAEVPRHTPLVLLSEDGADAYVAARKLAALGATSLYVLDGGMRLWPYELEKP